MNEAIELAFEEQGSGFPLVLLHGFPLDHTLWSLLLPALQGKARVILPDLRGHGRSPAPSGAYSMSLLAADVAGLLDRLRLEKVVLAGHSMGGYAALAFARAYPQRLAGLALVASTPFADPPERRQERLEQVKKVEQLGTAAVADGMAPTLTHHTEFHEDLRRLMLRTPPNGVIGSLFGMADRPDLTEFLQSLDLPTLILEGEQDARIPFERIQAVAARLRRGRLVIVPGAAHLPMLEAPEVTAGALLELFQRAAWE
jgi:3-oxoadipate enol-lactonase